MVFAQGELGSKVDDFLGAARPNSDWAPIDTLNDGGRFSQVQHNQGVTQAFHFVTQMPQWHLRAALKNSLCLLIPCMRAGGV
jgi:hypothetical protein